MVVIEAQRDPNLVKAKARRAQDEEYLRTCQEKDQEDRQIQFLSAFFRHESTSLNPAHEPRRDPRRKWVYLYKHPMDGLKSVLSTRALKLLFHIQPKDRVAWAVARNDPWVVEELAIRGHDCEVPNPSGFAPIHLAASHNYVNCLQVLIAVGCDINARTMLGFTPLYMAKCSNAKAAVQVLAKAGAVDKPFSNQTTAIYYRTCLDVQPRRVHRAMDAKAQALGRHHTYYGQY